MLFSVNFVISNRFIYSKTKHVLILFRSSRGLIFHFSNGIIVKCISVNAYVIEPVSTQMREL